MQHAVDARIDRVNKDDSFPPPVKWLVANVMPLDDDCILTVLMYALKQVGKDTDIPFVDDVKQKTVPLCRWDSPLTYYDFPFGSGANKLNSQDVVELFDVYEFSEDLFFADPDGQKKRVINALKERLLK